MYCISILYHHLATTDRLDHQRRQNAGMTAPTYRPRKHALALFIIDNGILPRMNGYIPRRATVDDENESRSLEGSAPMTPDR